MTRNIINYILIINYLWVKKTSMEQYFQEFSTSLPVLDGQFQTTVLRFRPNPQIIETNDF